MVFPLPFVVNSVFSTREQRCLRLKDENCDSWWRWYRVQTHVCVGRLIEGIVWFLSPLCFSLWRPVKLALGGRRRKKKERRRKHNNAYGRTGGAEEGTRVAMERRHLGRKKEGVYAHRLKRWEDRQKRRGGGWMCGGSSSVSVCECHSPSACQTSVTDRKPTQPLCCWGLSLNRCTFFTLTHRLMIQYIRICVRVCV